jgi:hypothetical protein
MRKTYGFSKRRTKIREDFISLDDACRSAYESGDREEFLRLNAEISDYVIKYRRQLRLSREFAEQMKTDTLEIAKIMAEEDYHEARLVRLKREAEELKQKIYEDVQKEETRGRLKWN